MRIIQIYDKLDRHGGAQSVLMNLDRYFNDSNIESYISGSIEYEMFYFKREVLKNRYMEFKLSNIFKFKNSIVISHSRKLTTYLVILNKLFSLKIKLIHIAHTVFQNKKHFTLYPKNIIAVSHAVKKNLIEYFNISEQQIDVIYNGIDDSQQSNRLTYYRQDENIKILLVGRIENIKQQVKLVDELSEKIANNIIIDFAGDGSQVNELEEIINFKGKKNFRYIGFHKEITSLIKDYHYILLFSQNEGLGLSLIEGIMMGKPLISRGIDGCEACSEVCVDKYNGWIVNSFSDLLQLLNSLQNVTEEDYLRLSLASRKHFEKHFKKETMLNSYYAYLQKVENYEK